MGKRGRLVWDRGRSGSVSDAQVAINVLDGQQRAIKWPSSGHQVAIKWPSKWPQWPSVAKSVPIVAHLLQHRDVRLERFDARAEVVILGLHSTGGRARLGKQLGAELELRSNGLPDEGGNRRSSEVIRGHQKSSEAIRARAPR